jgi:hypothetical protein
MSAYMHFVCYLSEGRWEIYIGLQKNKLLERKEKKERRKSLQWTNFFFYNSLASYSKT